MSFIIKAIPTGVTLCALVTGLTAMRLSFLGNFQHAIFSLVLSALCDGLDGHVARALQASSAFGAEMDSLCDLVDFGVSPAIVVYLWCVKSSTPSDEWWASDNLLWGACMFYAACCACRLARFNLSNEVPAPQPPHSTHFVEELEELEDESAPAGEPKSPSTIRQRRQSRSSRASLLIEGPEADDKKDTKTWLDDYVNRTKFFQGVPAPAGAYLMLMPMVYTFEYGTPKIGDWPLQTIVSGVFIGVGLLMVMTARTFSSKMLIKGPVRGRDPHTSHLRSRSPLSALFKLVLVGCTVYIFYTEPWKFFLVTGGLYFITLPLGPIVYHFLLSDHHK